MENYYPGFNSNMVRVKSVQALCDLIESYKRFNSNMVRVKSEVKLNVPAEKRGFQFQYGSSEITEYRQLQNGSVEVSIPIWFE